MSTRLLSRLAWWVALAALAELLLLRIATRTFVHIPGLELLSGPLAVVAEAGRLAFYLTVVLVIAFLSSILSSVGRNAGPSTRILMGGAGLMVVTAVLAGTSAVAPAVSGWMSVAAVGLAAVAALRAGWRALPLVLWAIALGFNASGVLLQGWGGGLDGGQFGGLLLAGDALGVAAAMTLPLLLGSRPSRSALWAGLIVCAVVTGAVWAASATTTILVLWSFGIPGALPPALYGIGAGAAVTTAWSATQQDRRPAAAAVVLLASGGFGLISTYQTTLVVTGLLVAAMQLLEERRSEARLEPVVESKGDLTPAIEPHASLFPVPR